MKQTYECVFPCQFRGSVTRKGLRVVIDSADLKAPGNEPLLSPASFRLVPAETPSASADNAHETAADKSARADLRRKLAHLKVATSEKATLAELTAALAAATDPLGADKP